MGMRACCNCKFFRSCSGMDQYILAEELRTNGIDLELSRCVLPLERVLDDLIKRWQVFLLQECCFGCWDGFLGFLVVLDFECRGIIIVGEEKMWSQLRLGLISFQILFFLLWCLEFHTHQNIQVPVMNPTLRLLEPCNYCQHSLIFLRLQLLLMVLAHLTHSRHHPAGLCVAVL